MKNATCTWGDGPDVVLSIENDFFILYEDPKHTQYPNWKYKKGDWKHGYVTKGSMDLTADEALKLASELIAAANNAKELDGLCKDADAYLDEDSARVFVSEHADIEMHKPLSKEAIDAMNDRPLESLTCHKCSRRDTCKYVDDAYNTDGDCLADK